MSKISHISANSGTADPSKTLMERVARRVREMRMARKIPRRVLSEMSGVSPRYLAQLEAGEGNISISLLQRVASALDVRPEELLTETVPLQAESLRVATQYQSASADVRDRVREILKTQVERHSRAGRICLVGLRGAGKSTLGRMVSEALSLPFIELTHEIENRSGMPVPEVLALYGADGYRRLEAEVLQAVLETHTRLILAVAGGIVSAPETYDTVLKECHCVWVRATPGEHMERVRAQGDMRPMEGHPKAMAQLRELLESRSEEYARAEAQLDTSNRSQATSLNDLLGIISSQRFLDE